MVGDVWRNRTSNREVRIVAIDSEGVSAEAVLNKRRSRIRIDVLVSAYLKVSAAPLPAPPVNGLWADPMPQFLRCIRYKVVVVGSVARTIRNPGEFVLPKDIDLLCDLDSDHARKSIARDIQCAGLVYESPFLASWTFRDYGWMVEIIGIHHGPNYRTVRRRADLMTIAGVELWVAQAADAPK
jgi:hypothetical protein